MKVFVVVLSFNGGKEILKCLQFLLMEKIKLIVVDNASTDGSLAKIKKLKGINKIITNKQNLGFSKGNNQGITFALSRGADLILLVNQDVFMKTGTLTSLIKAFEQDAALGIVAPVVKHQYQGRFLYDFGGQINPLTKQALHVNKVSLGRSKTFVKRDFASACCLLIRKEVFTKTGLFDENFFLYFEDIDFCYRASKKGFTIKVVPSSVVIHKTSSSLGKNSFALIYYNFRNHLFFVKKHFSFWQLTVSFLFDLLRVVYFFFKNRKVASAAFVGVSDFTRGKTGKMKQ